MKALQDTTKFLGTPILARAIGGGPTPSAAVARWRHGGGIVEVAPSNTIRLALSLVDERNARDRSGGPRTDQSRTASISVFSPTEGACVEVRGEADVLQLFLDQDHVQEMLDAPFACPPMLDLDDGTLRSMIMRIVVTSAGIAPDDALLTEQSLHALALRLQAHARQGRDRTEPASALFRGGLSPTVFRRIEDMMAAAIDEMGSLTLAQMARAAGLSTKHFTRAFRTHTGTTPHRHLVRRRMDRAVSLLRQPDVPVAEVSDRAGFSTPAHFVATFRTALGVTPGALRDALAR